MDDQLIDRLCALNTDFYRKTSGSFSSTRRNSWPGWDRLACIVEGFLPEANPYGPERNAPGTPGRPEGPRLHVIDLACGNMRFETFLEKRLGQAAITFTAVDNCDGFPQTQVESPCRFVKADLIEGLRGNAPDALADVPRADLAVSFGFAHHIPGRELRLALIERLTSLLAPGGIGAVSLWDFAQDPQMAQRAEETTALARDLLQLPPMEGGDYILGWQNETEAFRYCHSFCEHEVDELVRAAQPHACLLDRFKADGRTGSLNTYLVFKGKDQRL